MSTAVQMKHKQTGNYTHRLLQSGFEFSDTPERTEDAKRALGIAG